MNDQAKTNTELIEEISVLKQRIKEMERSESERKRAGEVMEKRLMALTQPLDDAVGIAFEDLFDMDEIQRIQDEFANATGVASIITHVDGTPITRPSNFCRLCKDIIRKTERGRKNCYQSDAIIGQRHPSGPIVQPCLSGGLWDAGASISVGGRHIANWLIGQVRNEAQTEKQMLAYAREIGADEQTFMEAFREVTTMSRKRFEQIAQVLFTLANQLSNSAYQTIQQARFISDRKKAEEELRETQRRLADIIEFLPDATLVIDKDGNIIAWNRAIESMAGVKAEDMLGKGNYEYALPFYGDRRPILIDLALHPDLEKEKSYTSVRRTGDIVFGESYTPALATGNVHLSGTASVLRDSKGKIIGAIECIRNNTDRKNMEERLQRSEKMESLGVLAGGVAHDLNNVLGVLVGYSELLLREAPEGSRTEKYAKSILQGGERAAAIIQDLLTMARRGVSVSNTVNLNQIVADSFKTPEFELVKSRHPDVLFRSQVEKDLFNIKGSPVHLSKTIMNLLSNAAESIRGSGEVTITTENRYVDVSIQGYENTREGEYVVLTVMDTGSGISPADIGQIFEPFYTKKIMGRSGTGLGLAVVWGTVKDHGGYIDVSTEENKGSTFTLYFPVTRDDLSKSDQALSQSEYRGRGESILIVDDVEEQRFLAATILEGLNYRVATAASGEDTVEYLKTHKMDMIVLDMIMDPGIDGLETYRRVLEIRPHQKAIIVSGFAMTERVRIAQELGAGEYVKKPYLLEKIGQAVRRELDRI